MTFAQNTQSEQCHNRNPTNPKLPYLDCIYLIHPKSITIELIKVLLTHTQQTQSTYLRNQFKNCLKNIFRLDQGYIQNINGRLIYRYKTEFQFHKTAYQITTNPKLEILKKLKKKRAH
jgi:hypothetical protein